MNFPFQIIVSNSYKRKTISLRLMEGILYVRAPNYVSYKEIEKIVNLRIKWINKKIIEEKVFTDKHSINYKNGDIFLFGGKKNKLKVKESFQNKIFISQNILNVHTKESYQDKKKIRNQIINWYFKEASININKTVLYYKELMGVSVNKIKISQYKSKWGSCSKSKNLTFDWRIILAPKKVLEYLVVHELSHLNHSNHSIKFWKHVELYMSDFDFQRKWLTKNSRIILNQFKNIH